MDNVKRVDIPAHAITAHKGFLQNWLEEDVPPLCLPDDPIGQRTELNWTVQTSTNTRKCYHHHHHHHHHHHLSLNHEGRVGHHRWFHNRFPPFFPASPLPPGTWTPGLSSPWCCLPTSSSVWCCLPTSSSVCLVFFPLFVPSKMVLARPDDRETWPYHCSLRLFTMIRSWFCGSVKVEFAASSTDFCGNVVLFTATCSDHRVEWPGNVRRIFFFLTCYRVWVIEVYIFVIWYTAFWSVTEWLKLTFLWFGTLRFDLLLKASRGTRLKILLSVLKSEIKYWHILVFDSVVSAVHSVVFRTGGGFFLVCKDFGNCATIHSLPTL